MRLLVLPCLALLLAAGPQPAPHDGADVIRMMHDRYANTRFRTLTFTQKTIRGDGSVQTWYEAEQLPGKLRIDVAPTDSMNTLLFRSDSLYVIRGGKIARAQPLVHALLIMLADVFVSPPEQSIARIQDQGFDLTKLREDTWNGRPIYVIGAPAGDTLTNQLWIDKERLYLVRMIEGGEHHQDTQVPRYVQVGGGWSEAEVDFYVGGKLRQREEYSDLHPNAELDPALFLPEPYTPATWMKQ